jgi:hypothetical protein
MILFIEKDAQLAHTILTALMKYWPKSNSAKQICFLNEVEEIFESLSLEDLHPLAPMIFKKIAECIQSPHFQVAERSLAMFQNDYLAQLIVQTKPQTIPLLFMALYGNTKQHWNASVISLTYAQLKALMEMDAKLFSQCASAFKKKNEQEHTLRSQRDAKWESIEVLAKRLTGGRDGGALSSGVHERRSGSTGISSATPSSSPALGKSGSRPSVSAPTSQPAPSTSSAVPARAPAPSTSSLTASQKLAPPATHSAKPAAPVATPPSASIAVPTKPAAKPPAAAAPGAASGTGLLRTQPARRPGSGAQPTPATGTGASMRNTYTATRK